MASAGKVGSGPGQRVQEVRAGLLGWGGGCVPSRDWRSASQEPVGLAPDPATTPEAVVQVYAARTVGWNGGEVHSASGPLGTTST